MGGTCRILATSQSSSRDKIFRSISGGRSVKDGICDVGVCSLTVSGLLTSTEFGFVDNHFKTDKCPLA